MREAFPLKLSAIGRFSSVRGSSELRDFDFGVERSRPGGIPSNTNEIHSLSDSSNNAWQGNQADKSVTEPMRFLKANERVFERDTYRSQDIFQEEDGYFYELNQKCIEQIASNLQSPDPPSTPATLYAGPFPIDSEMINEVIVAGRAVDTALANANEQLRQRHQEGLEFTGVARSAGNLPVVIAAASRGRPPSSHTPTASVGSPARRRVPRRS